MGRRTAKQGNASKAVGYLRVSTTEQHLGPDAQREALESWCAANGVELAAVYTDHGISGRAAIDKRPALLDAINAIAEHSAGVLLVHKRDRLARDMVAAVAIESMAAKQGATVVTTEGEVSDPNDPTAFLQRAMKDMFAQYEALQIASRTRAALAVKKSRGERVGQVPFGYRLGEDGVHLVEHDSEQRVIELVQALRADGLSLRAITARLNDDAVPARGKKWHTTTVARMVARTAA